MSLSSLVSRVVPAAIGFATGGPVGAFTATVATEQAKTEQKKIQTQNAILAQQREKLMAEIFQGQGLSSIQPNVQAQSTQNAGMGGFLGGVKDFFGGIGTGISTGIGEAIGGLFGQNRPRGVGQQPAITTVTNVGAQESQGSGSIQAGVGSLIPQLFGGLRTITKSPIGQILTGTGIGTAVGMLGSDGKQMRITRKMKAQARSLLNMTGGNLQLTADFLGISEQQLVFILLKRFRNDGPVVTKAALRKTKSTIRKLKNMCDMYDDLRPAARRRTPMRRATRASTTLIKN